MFKKLKGVEDRFYELEKLVSKPIIIKNRAKYQSIAKEHFEISKLVSVFKKYKSLSCELSDSLELATDEDAEIRILANEDLHRLKEEKKKIEEKLKLLLIPKNPMDKKNVILEIRAGTGGQEAALFASELLKMYQRYSENNGWKVDILTYSVSSKGGFKEIIVNISGVGAYSKLKHEGGTHRVQRIPVTETQGRIHTSAVTVAVLPEAEEIEVRIDPSELRVDFFRSSGPGGQSVNTTDSAVRITHLETGLVVTCQDEKSQHKNKSKALKVLRARLLNQKAMEQNNARSQTRKNQVGSGDRSGRIRTYNFPQTRVTDHRIDCTLYKLDKILHGDIDEIIEQVASFHQSEAIKNSLSE